MKTEKARTILRNNNFIHSTDTENELQLVKEAALENGAFDAVVCTHWADGSKGAEDLAEAVIHACEQPGELKFLYDLDIPLEEKINVVAREMYGAGSVEIAPNVKETLDKYTEQVKVVSQIYFKEFA